MRRLIASAMALGLVLAGCSSEASPPAASPAPQSEAPTAVASASAVPASPVPASSAPVVTAAPSASAQPTPIPSALAQSILLKGIRKDAKVDCAAQQTGLPTGAVAGVECRPGTKLVATVGFYLFASQDQLLSSYFGLLSAHGVQPRSGDCFGAKAGEDATTPGDGTSTFIADREGCFVASGKAADLATFPGEPVGDGGYTFGGPFVLVVIDGASSNPGALHTWAWLGNQAEPGAPTVWQGQP